MVPDLPTQPTPHVAPGTVRTGGTEKRDASSVSYRMNFKKLLIVSHHDFHRTNGGLFFSIDVQIK
jgi:hypothetical protein